MAPDGQVGLSFDEILQRGTPPIQQKKALPIDMTQDRDARQRKEAQELANDIFGRGRKEKLQQNGPRKNGIGPSLASRVGISKVVNHENET